MFVKNGGRLVDCTVVCTAANDAAWLSDKAKLTILLKPLSEALLPETAQSYLKNLSEPVASDDFETDPFGGWILGTGWPLLKQE